MGTPANPSGRWWRPRRAVLPVLAILAAGALAACSGAPTATPATSAVPTSTTSSSPTSIASASVEPAELLSSSMPSPVSASPSASASPAPPASSSAAAPATDCVGPYGPRGETATLIATRGELTCDEMTVAWLGFRTEYPEIDGQVPTTSAGWTCTWIDGPGPLTAGAQGAASDGPGEEGGPGCYREGTSFGPLVTGTGQDGGSAGGDCRFPGYNGSTLSIQNSTVSCAEARRIWDLPTVESFGKRVTKGEGWECSYGGAGDGWVNGCSNESTGDGFSVVPSDGDSSTGDGGSTPGGGSGSSGSVTVPLANRGCDGTGIVLLTAAVTPGSYQQDIDAALAANPGASVLRTDASCSSLAPATDAGDPIYAVYLPTGSSDRGEVCAAVRAAGGGAYGKWLDSGLSPDASRIDC